MGRPAFDISGKKFGRWRVLGRGNAASTKSAHWLCICECGSRASVRGDTLRKGQTVSCGCYKAEVAGTCARSHGQTRTPTWRSWMAMRTRRYDPKHVAYHRYGGRGITVCRRWLHSFENFLADMGKRPVGRSLDRKDNDGNYSPRNCRWATPKMQSNNRVGSKSKNVARRSTTRT